MPAIDVDTALARRLYERARAARWDVPIDRFAEALERSAARAFPVDTPNAGELQRYLAGLHLEDLALAVACAAGHEGAWEHFVREHRPALYRAAHAIDASGAARDLADSLYAELFGLEEKHGARQSLFRYFHGRSSLATWLRAIMAQRHVDRIRVGRRMTTLPDEESVPPGRGGEPSDPGRAGQLARLRRALGRAVGRLDPRDRLRLSCYYAQELTLAEIGRATGEHEATVSRHLARARKAIRVDVEAQLRTDGWSDAEIRTCLLSAMEDAGDLDIAALLARDRKKQERGSF
jgi:RNA polymerase sigma-70 factor (ECF subfamily)